VSLGAPASVGGLGVVLAAVALTGPSPPLFLDGAPLLTRMPLLFPADLTRVTGKNPPPPNPNYLVSVEITPEAGRWFIPAPGDRVLGEPFAIPLDGSSVSNDLLQSRAGAAVAAGLARPIGAGFVADVTRRVLPAVGSGGSRLPVEQVDALSLADDGPGNGVTLMVFPADRLGNPTDPAQPATTVVLHGGTGLAITAPDSDGDPLQETITFTTAEAVAVTLDDTGGSGDSGAITDLVATVDGAPTAAVRITIGTGSGGGPAALSAADVKLNIGGGGRDRLRLRAATGATTIDPSTNPVRLTLGAGAETLYDRLLPAGSLAAGGKRFSFKDASGGTALLKVVVVRRADGSYALRAAVSKLTLPAGAAASPVTLTFSVGTRVFTATLACDVNNAGTATRCH
jgi:hypothetical protein